VGERFNRLAGLKISEPQPGMVVGELAGSGAICKSMQEMVAIFALHDLGIRVHTCFAGSR